MTFGFYALFLKKTVGCTINYGKTKYDFDDETVVCFAPGQTVGIHRIEDGPVPEADALLFHPDFLLRTPLAQKMKQYSFFRMRPMRRFTCQQMNAPSCRII